LRTRISDLNLKKSLNDQEVAEAKLWLEVQTRSFVKAAVAGRGCVWVDMDGGKKVRALVVLDLIVKNFSVQKASDNTELGICPVSEVVPKRALTIEDVANSETFLELSGADQDNAVAWVKADGSTWVFVEESPEKVDENLAAVTLLSGAGLGGQDGATKGRGGKKKKTNNGLKLSPRGADGEKELSPVTPRAGKSKPPESEEPEEEAEEPSASKKDKKEKKEKGDKGDKKEKKEKKDKKDKKEKK